MKTLDDIVPNQDKALLLAKRQLTELVYDAVNLEGINFTLPEVQTLLDGITIGGRKISDQRITLNQSKAWSFIFNAIQSNDFELSSDFACKVHGIAGFEEALEWGQFRSGGVTIAGTDYMPPKANELATCWDKMIKQIIDIENPFDQAIALFLQMARNQFFYDVNKRMGRFMMNGLLLSQGYPAINLPAKRQLEFNQLMIDFYNSNDMGPMTEFMKSCLDPRIIEIMSE